MLTYRCVVVNTTTTFILCDISVFLASLQRAPLTVWRVETGFCHSPGRTAADVIRYEQELRGRAPALSPEHIPVFELHPADALLWVTFSFADALHFGRAEDVIELRLDIRAYVVASDEQGGFLLFFPDEITQLTGGAVMADRFEDDPATELRAAIKAEIYADAIPVEHAQPQVAPATPTPAAVDEEEKRRAARGGGDMGNPPDAQLGANIRPDIGSGPGGLETLTTQKSADYRADPDAENVSAYIRERLADAARSVNQPILTLETIAADPWNAVELPLPANVDKELLIAARSAAEYCADGHHELMEAARRGDHTPPGWTGADNEPDAHEYDEARWLQADTRLAVINDRLEALDPATREANDASTKRQERERAAATGESLPGDAPMRTSDYITSRLNDAREAAEAERGGPGAELDIAEHGEGQTPAGGGGRGMF